MTLRYDGIRLRSEVTNTVNKWLIPVGSRRSQRNKLERVELIEVITIIRVSGTVPMNKSLIRTMSKWNFVGF